MALKKELLNRMVTALNQYQNEDDVNTVTNKTSNKLVEILDNNIDKYNRGFDGEENLPYYAHGGMAAVAEALENSYNKSQDTTLHLVTDVRIVIDSYDNIVDVQYKVQEIEILVENTFEINILDESDWQYVDTISESDVTATSDRPLEPSSEPSSYE